MLRQPSEVDINAEIPTSNLHDDWMAQCSLCRKDVGCPKKSLPVGFFGIFMIVAELMDIGSDFLVSGLVQPIQIPGRCAFGQGIVLTATPVNYTSIHTFWGVGY
jgi:hypothetical protein